MKIKNQDIKGLAARLGIRTPDVQLLLAQERFLARILSHPEGQSFIWKGGSLVLRAYRQLSPPRFTVDLDFLIRGITVPDAGGYIQRAADTDLDDAFTFYDVTSSPMERETPYGGDRFEIRWTMEGKAGAQTLKIDICAGDFVEAEKRSLAQTTFFCDETLSIQIYPAEYIFAEKLETLARFGTGSTRTKDLIDLWSLRSHIPGPAKLRQAVERCFQRRGTVFSLRQFLEISTNEDFARFHDSQLKRRFKALKTPGTADMLAEITKCIEEAMQSQG